MTQADRVYITPPTNTSANNPPGVMTRDDELGMAWWNALSERQRAKWSTIAGNTGRVKDAWEAFKRGSVDQTPPVDPTRRRFLITAAIGSVVGAGSLAAAAMAPNDVPEAVTVPLALGKPVSTSAPDPMFGMIEAHRKADRDHEAALDEQERLERIGDEAADWVGEASCHAAFKAFDALLSAAATTVPGILAQLAYLQEIATRGCSMTARTVRPASSKVFRRPSRTSGRCCHEEKSQ